MSKEGVVSEIHRSARKNFERRTYQMRGIDDTFQADLVEMIPHSKMNNNYKYILMVIDVFSKFAWTVPLKNKTGNEVTRAMKSIFTADKRVPKNLHTDQGKEFYNSFFQQLMKDYKINHYSTYSKMKASIVERFNRTILTKIWRMFSLQGSYKWLKILKSVTNTYNHTVHRTIKMKPSEVNSENSDFILRNAFRNNNALIMGKKSKFSLNDFVRISKYKSIFEKGYTPSWSTEIFQVYKIQVTKPVTYLLKDSTGQKISGSFYEQELMKTKYPTIYLVEKILRKKGDKLYVKWLGFDNSENSWIKKSAIV